MDYSSDNRIPVQKDVASCPDEGIIALMEKVGMLIDACHKAAYQLEERIVPVLGLPNAELSDDRDGGSREKSILVLDLERHVEALEMLRYRLAATNDRVQL